MRRRILGPHRRTQFASGSVDTARNIGEAAVEIKRSFAPVAGPSTRLLLLGSLPGEVSLAQGRYYAHPRNQFWALMGAVLGTDLLDCDYQLRLDRLLDAGIGLWDVVASATRTGSLDGSIRDHVANELEALAASLPELRAVAFNGTTAAAIGRRQLERLTGLELIELPSSSPAYTLPLSQKLERWMALRAWLPRESAGRNP